MVYIDNLDDYEEVYDETPSTTDFIYYDAGKLKWLI